jgi:hypothetical protein
MGRCTSKIYASVLALAVAVLVSLAPRSAKACGSGGGSGDYTAAIVTAGVIVIGVAGADVVFTGYDLSQAVQEERASKGMAIAEISVAAPQFAIGSLALANMPRNSSSIPMAVYVAWMGTLVGHGIGTLATMPAQPPSFEPTPEPKKDTKPPKEKDEEWLHPHLSVAPTMLNDGMRATLVPGVAAVGTF